MRAMCLAVGLTLCSGSVLAADFGIGASARSDDGMLYVPIDVSKSFRLEPSVRYASVDDEVASSSGSFSSDSDTLEIGIGVFGIKQITEAGQIYFGGRVAYVDQETKTVSDLLTSDSYEDSKLDGYRVGPTLGFEYRFGQHFSIGGEASYTFVDLDGETKSTRIFVPNLEFRSVTDEERKTNGTQTHLIFRYMF